MTQYTPVSQYSVTQYNNNMILYTYIYVCVYNKKNMVSFFELETFFLLFLD
jgi:hypothetical protein